MKKNIFKKIVAVLATTAMAVGLVAAPAMEASAADSVYVVGVNGTWGFDYVLTSTDGENYTGEIDFATGGDLSILYDDTWENVGEITAINDNTNVYDKDGRDAVWFLGDGDTAGTYTVTWNESTGVITARIKEVSTTVWTYEYYVAGEEALEAELWSNSDAASYGEKGKMTKSGTTWTYTATTSADFDGTAGYNVMKIGVPDDDSDRTIEWLKDGDAAFACTGKGAGTLTITFDEETNASTCTFVADNTNTDNTNTDNTNTDNTNTDNTNTDNTNTDNTITDNTITDNTNTDNTNTDNTNTDNTNTDNTNTDNTNTDNTNTDNTNTDNTNTDNTNTDANAGTNSNDSTTGNASGTPNTGDSTSVALYLVVAALAAVVVLKKRTATN